MEEPHNNQDNFSHVLYKTPSYRPPSSPLHEDILVLRQSLGEF
jgi:hypothetical protein